MVAWQIVATCVQQFHHQHFYISHSLCVPSLILCRNIQWLTLIWIQSLFGTIFTLWWHIFVYCIWLIYCFPCKLVLLYSFFFQTIFAHSLYYIVDCRYCSWHHAFIQYITVKCNSSVSIIHSCTYTLRLLLCVVSVCLVLFPYFIHKTAAAAGGVCTICIYAHNLCYIFSI